MHLEDTSDRSGVQLVQAWGDFLAPWPWSWFTTHTFEDRTHPEAAIKCWNRWIHQLNREIFGVRYTARLQDGVLWVRGLEYQKRGVIHFHALVGRVPDDVGRFDFMKRWELLAGYARIFPYDPVKGARYYLGKYVAKGGEIDVGGPLQLDLAQMKFDFGQVDHS